MLVPDFLALRAIDKILLFSLKSPKWTPLIDQYTLLLNLKVTLGSLELDLQIEICHLALQLWSGAAWESRPLRGQCM